MPLMLLRLYAGSRMPVRREENVKSRQEKAIVEPGGYHPGDSILDFSHHYCWATHCYGLSLSLRYLAQFRQRNSGRPSALRHLQLWLEAR